VAHEEEATATMMIQVVGSIFLIIGALIALVVTTVLCALALPLCFLYALASAIWAGEVHAFRSADEDTDEADEEPSEFASDATLTADETRAKKRNRRNSSVRVKSSAHSTKSRRRPHPDHEIARRSYYFGPNLKDLIDSVKAMWPAGKRIVEKGQSIVELTEDASWEIVPMCAYLSIDTGLALGAIAGAAGIAALAALRALVDIVSTCVASCSGFLLRGIDIAMRYATGVSFTCPGGHKVAPYPYYHCPECRALHRDIRPGAYGIAVRQCTCGKRFPTMLVIGAGRLSGICRFCETGLPPRFGLAPEIVIPIYGAVNAGKTRLMYMLATVLIDWVKDKGGTVHYVEDASERLASIKDSIRINSNTAPTVPITPRGLGLDIQIRLNRRFVYFFDAAGEMFRREDDLAEMKFFNKARTYIHVADPLSSRSLREQLTQNGRVDGSASSSAALDEVYQRVADLMRRLPRQKKRANLAFVVSKKDTLDSLDVSVGDNDEDVLAWIRDPSGLDMADAIRAASQRFAETRYFATAALEEDGRVDFSVVRLMNWILAAEGITMGGYA
jgi:Double-GTPase 2